MERLRGLDSAFLYLETPTNHLHVAWAAVLDTSAHPDAASVEAMAELVAARIHRLPALRRRLADPAVRFVHPEWIDVYVNPRDHITLHRSERLEPVAERVMAAPLDRRRPLWELHLVHGLAGARTGLLMKMHHALLDGPSGAELMVQLLDFEPGPPDLGRPEPVPVEAVPTRIAAARARRQRLRRGPARMASELRRYGDVRAAAQRWDVDHPGERVPAPRSAPRTVFNQAITMRRSVRFTDAPLDGIDELRRPVGATVNDVVLAVCGGMARRYLARHGGIPETSLQAMVPVSTHTGRAGTTGNAVSSITTVLGTTIADPLERLAEVHRVTDIAKRRHDDTGSGALVDLADLVPPRAGRGLSRLATRLRASSWAPVPWNAVISNVPGPDTPFYCNGAPVVRAFPMGPLTDWAALNVTVVSYRRRLAFGVVTCPDVVPDADELLGDLRAELDALRLIDA